MRTKTKFYTVLLCMFLSLSLLVTGAILAMPRMVIAEDTANTVVVDETTYYTKVAQDAMPVYDLYAWDSGKSVTVTPTLRENKYYSREGHSVTGVPFTDDTIWEFGFKAHTESKYGITLRNWQYGTTFEFDFVNNTVRIGRGNLVWYSSVTTTASGSIDLKVDTLYGVRFSELKLYETAPTSETTYANSVGEIISVQVVDSTDPTNCVEISAVHTTSRPGSATSASAYAWGCAMGSETDSCTFTSYKAIYLTQTVWEDIEDISAQYPNSAGTPYLATGDGNSLWSHGRANSIRRVKVRFGTEDGADFIYAEKDSDPRDAYFDIRFSGVDRWEIYVARIHPHADGSATFRLMYSTTWARTLQQVTVDSFDITKEYVFDVWRHDLTNYFDGETPYARIGFRILSADGQTEVIRLEELCFETNYRAHNNSYWWVKTGTNAAYMYSANSCKVTLNNGEESNTTVEVSNGYALPVLSNTQTKVFIGWKDANGNLLKADTLSGEFALGTGATYTYTAVWAEFYMTAGASIRVEADSGIRFTSIINSADLESLGNVTSGMRILRSTADGSTVEGGVDILADEEKLVETDGLLTFNGVVIGISDYTKLYEARSWLEITYANGTGSAEKVYAVASDNQRSIQQVATIILEKYNAGEITLSSSNLTLLEKMAGGVA